MSFFSRLKGRTPVPVKPGDILSMTAFGVTELG